MGDSSFDAPGSDESGGAVSDAQLEWHGPPAHVVGQPVAVSPFVFRGDAAAVTAEGFVAYPTGVEFRLVVRARTAALLPFRGVVPPRWEATEGEEAPRGRLRVTVLFADRRAANPVDPPFGTAVPPSGPVLAMRGGGDSGRRWFQDVWLWPLPPAGPLWLVVAWPARGLPETRVELDASVLVEAAGGAAELWPDTRPVLGGANGAAPL